MQDLGPDDVSRALRGLPRDQPAGLPGDRGRRRAAAPAAVLSAPQVLLRAAVLATSGSTGCRARPPTARWRRPRPSEDAEYDDAALDAMYAATGGYPYFIQAYGKAVWDLAPRSPITADDVAVAAPEAERELAVGFFGARYDRATPAERDYLRAMADAARRAGAATTVGRGGHRRRRRGSARSRSRSHPRATR